jgi:hypothetical protein
MIFLRNALVIFALIAISSEFAIGQTEFDVIHLNSGSKLIGTILIKEEARAVRIILRTNDVLDIDPKLIKSFGKVIINDSAARVSQNEPASQQYDPLTGAPHLPLPKTVVYVDFASMLLLGNFSLNVEHLVSRNTYLRIGVGKGWAMYGQPTNGALVMANYLTDGDQHHFEIGAGGSIVADDNQNGRTAEVLPSFTIGYRYQLESFLVRFGLAYTYRYGAPVFISVGLAL